MVEDEEVHELGVNEEHYGGKNFSVHHGKEDVGVVHHPRVHKGDNHGEKHGMSDSHQERGHDRRKISVRSILM